MSRYRAVVRVVFAVAFLGGALVRLYFGLFVPRIYAPFADTVLWSRLAELWRCFVMASFGWLSLLTVVFELAVGLGLLARGCARRAAVLAALGCFAFILVLGYSWPADGWWEDFVKNRAGPLVMAAVLVSLLRAPDWPRRA